MNQFWNFFTLIFEVNSCFIFQLYRIAYTLYAMRSEIKAAAAQVTLAVPVNGSLMSRETCVLSVRCHNPPLPHFSVVVRGEHENLKSRYLLRAIDDTIFKR
jgi:hypothetical protein